MNMNLHFYETTIKTILGTILKKFNRKFFPIQNLAYLQLIFTSVINFFKNIPIPDFSSLAMFLFFLGVFRISSNPKYPSCEGFANFVSSCTKCFLLYVSLSSKNYDLN